MAVEHQLSHMHEQQTQVIDSECITCVHRNVIVMSGQAETEAYNAAAGIQNIYTMKSEFDKSKMSISQLKRHKKMIQDLWDASWGPVCEDIGEYLYFIDNNVTLAKQLLAAMQTDNNAVTCASVLFEKLQMELDRSGSVMIGDINTGCTVGIYAGAHTDVERNDVYIDFFSQYTQRWLCEYNSKNVRCQFFGMNTKHFTESSVAQPEFNNRFNVIRNAFEVYRRIVDINLLSAAPYGTVTMSVRTFCFPMRDNVLICMSHSAPAAYRLATRTQHGITACVSIANMASLNEYKRTAFANYAIYLPFDIDTAIYLRFCESKMYNTLSERISELRESKISTPYGVHDFIRIRMRIFFDRGIFNAHILDDKFKDSEKANELRLKLIDLYRNIHWMGLNTFYAEASLVFPRIMARLTSRKEHEIKADSILPVEDILFEINVVLENAHTYASLLRMLRPGLYKICKANIRSAFNGDFTVAHESVRLALGMTHESVHEYATRVKKKGYAVGKYVRMAILCSGEVTCDTCARLYVRAIDNHSGYTHGSRTLLQRIYDSYASQLSFLLNGEYTLSYTSPFSAVADQSLQAKLNRMMFYLCQELKSDLKINEVSPQVLLSEFQHKNSMCFALSDKSVCEPESHSTNILLNTMLQAQMGMNTHSIRHIHSRRTKEQVHAEICSARTQTDFTTGMTVSMRSLRAQQNVAHNNCMVNSTQHNAATKRPHSDDDNTQNKKQRTFYATGYNNNMSN